MKLKDKKYKIEYLTNEEIKQRVNNTDPEIWFDGCVMLDEHVIYMNKALSPERFRETLRHECMHALHCEYNQNVLNQMSTIDEEIVIRLTSPMLDDISKMLIEVEKEVEKHARQI